MCDAAFPYGFELLAVFILGFTEAGIISLGHRSRVNTPGHDLCRAQLRHPF